VILPSKHLSQERALLTVGGRVLLLLSQPKTVSALWGELNSLTETPRYATPPLSYDVFVLALDLLYSIGAVEMEDGLLARKRP
jgi:hypothetical protein